MSEKRPWYDDPTHWVHDCIVWGYGLAVAALGVGFIIFGPWRHL